MTNNPLEKPGIAIAVLAVGVVAVVGACWNAPFSVVDDGLMIGQLLSHDASDSFRPHMGRHFMPVTDLSLHLDYFLAPQSTVKHIDDLFHGRAKEFELHQSWAAQMRVMSALYHFAAAILLWLFLRRLNVGAGTALLVSLVWAGHPMACESVCWIAERKSVLAAMFGFGALAAWTLPPEKPWRWPLVYALYALALLSKPSALGLLPLFIALEILDPIRRQFNIRERSHWLTLVKRVLVPVVLSMISARITAYVFTYDIVEPLGGSLFATLLTGVSILWTYAQHVLLPVDLNFLYAVQPITSLADARFWILLMLLGGLVYALIRLTDEPKRYLAILGVLWFFGSLGPNSNLVPTAFPMQDRFAYLGTPGLWLAAVVAVQSVLQRRGAEQKMHYYVAVASALLVLILAGTRSSHFASSEALIAETAIDQPNSAYAQLLAADICSREHQRANQARNVDATLRWGNRALKYYEQTLAAPDSRYFKDPLYLRTRMVETYLGMLSLRRQSPQKPVKPQEFEDAHKLLDGWLPPKDMTMIPIQPENAPVEPRRRVELGRSYTARNLAHAWVLAAEASLQLANMPGIPRPAQNDLCKRAINEAEQGQAVDPKDFSGTLVKARTLMLMGYLASDDGKYDEAAKLFANGQQILKGVPESNSLSGQAKAILTSAKPPMPKPMGPPGPPGPQPPAPAPQPPAPAPKVE